MKIWLVNEGENLPGDDNNPRLQRMGLLAYVMADHGVDVTWWQSTYNHYQKKFRYDEDKDIQLGEKFEMKLIHSIGYKKNVCVRRMVHETITARKFYRKAEEMLERPDVMVVAMPTIIQTSYAVKFAKKNNIPIVVDVRDLNPDVFTAPFKGIFKAAVSVGIVPLKYMLSKALKHADGIVGTTQQYLDWALNYAKRPQGSNDEVFFVSYKDTGVKPKATEKKWRDYDFTGKIVCCFFGQFGKLVDFDTIIDCVRKYKDAGNFDYIFLLCGTGEKLEYYQEKAKDLDNVVLPGWVNKDDIAAIGSISDVGLMAYKPNDNFEKQMPNKFSEYLSLGLVIGLQPTGVMKDLINSKQCGFSYSDVDSLKSALNALKEDPYNLEEMKKKSRTVFENSFSSDVEYLRYMKYVEKIGGKK